MKHIKTYQLFESVHDTKEEIEEIISTCKDILLEANDTFSSNSNVEKSYKDDKLTITCAYTVPFNTKVKVEEYKSSMNDIHGRLIEYMTSQGFTYNNRGDESTNYFDIVLGSITYNISFSKELDKEFIGHLRYLKKYNINESIDANIKSDIEDIALELTDCEIYYEITDRKYWKNGVDSEEALIIYLRDNQNRFFTIKDIEDVILRLKDYLKDMDYSIDLSIPDSDDYLTFDEFIEEFSGEELYHVNVIIYHNPRISPFQRKYTAHEDFYESVNESTEEDLKDILLDLQDMGYRVIHNDDVLLAVTGEPSNVKAIVVRDVMKPSEWVELPWSELKEYALRIKDYLGDKYLDFSYRSIFAGEESNLYKKVELNEMTEIDDRVWSFAIKYKE